MDFNTFKNVAFASFTFVPVLVLALALMAILYVSSQLLKNRINYIKILKLSFKAMLYQLYFLVGLAALFGGLYLAQKVEQIPLILLLPLSTIVSFVAFIKLYWSARREVHT